MEKPFEHRKWLDGQLTLNRKTTECSFGVHLDKTKSADAKSTNQIPVLKVSPEDESV